ncbi:MAG: hypothetical protein ACREUF_04385 [Solimonas sp.]
MSADFHPGLFKAIVALGLLFVAAAWGFAGHGITDMLLVVVSGLFLGSMGLVTVLRRTRHRHPRDDLGDRDGHKESFGSIATIEILLPIAAVAVGMVAFAVVVHFAGHA